MKKNTRENVLKLIAKEKEYAEEMHRISINMENEKLANYYIGKAAAFSEVMELFNSNVYYNDVLRMYDSFYKIR